MRIKNVDNKINSGKPTYDEVKKSLNEFPNAEVEWNVVKVKCYDYKKIPGYSGYLEGPKKNDEIIILSLNKLYDLYCNLKKRYYKHKDFVKVVILLPSPELFESQVIIFFDKVVYANWFKRNSKYQNWTITKKINPLVEKFGLSNYKKLKEIHYKEIINDSELKPSMQENDLWFYE